MAGLASNLPLIVMIGLQIHYAALAIFTRAALLDGLSTTVFVVYRQGIATLALAPIFFSPKRFEKVDISLRSTAKILGTVCCVAGALTMALVKGQKLLHTEFLPSIHLTGSQGDDWLLGCLLLLASSVFWSCWMILQAALFALLSESDLQAWILQSPLQISCSLYAGIGIAVSFFIQSWCISERGPLYCAMFNPLATVITALISATFLEEEVYVGSLVGAVGVIAGLYVVLWGKAKEFAEIKPEAPQSSNLLDDEISSRIDLEQPLLSEKLSEHATEADSKS
ncbi:hypothetical protein JHK85_036473 [Glycine max]|nr:hypothetical protein JHK85_036473 [Glycine max]